MSIEIPYHFAHLLPVSKKISSKSDFLPFFFLCVFSHVYRPRQGQTTHRGQNFMTTERPFLFASFKMISSKSDFIHIFNDLTHVYSPGPRAENPYGTNFWCQQKALITLTICCKFQINLFEFWFYTHFCLFLYMYIVPEQGQNFILT